MSYYWPAFGATFGVLGALAVAVIGVVALGFLALWVLERLE